MVAVSGDRPDRLAPGEPSLWRVLRERVTAPTTTLWSSPGDAGSMGAQSQQHQRPVDVVLHAGGQAWMGDAFEDAWELLKRRAMDPVLCVDGGWREAQEEAAERMREVTVGLPKTVGHFCVCSVEDALRSGIVGYDVYG